MKAMILAAGLGTRLRPLTDDRPKALVQVGGRTMLEITLARLRGFGIREVIINVHHFADRMQEYLRANHNFGMHIEVSREETLMDTGGGLKKAAPFFLQDPQEPFMLHNVDVISTIDFASMLRFHTEREALVTLAVTNRPTSRYLLFDEQSRLCRRPDDGEAIVAPAFRHLQALAFSGIHVISPRLFPLMTEKGVFSIISCYLRLAGLGERILGFRADGYAWRDMGTAESIREAVEEMGQ